MEMELVHAWGLSGTCTVLKTLPTICGTSARCLSLLQEANLDRSPCQLIFSTSQVPNLGPQSIIQRSPVYCCVSTSHYCRESHQIALDCGLISYTYSWIFIFQDPISSFPLPFWLGSLVRIALPGVCSYMSSVAEIASVSLAFSFLYDPSLSRSGPQWLDSLLLLFS
jgi:hypothetical protein